MSCLEGLSLCLDYKNLVFIFSTTTMPSLFFAFCFLFLHLDYSYLKFNVTYIRDLCSAFPRPSKISTLSELHIFPKWHLSIMFALFFRILIEFIQSPTLKFLATMDFLNSKRITDTNIHAVLFQDIHTSFWVLEKSFQNHLSGTKVWASLPPHLQKVG